MSRSLKTSAACASALGILLACGGERPPAAAASAAAFVAVGAWARAADSGATTAAYLTVRNGTAVADTIVGVASDAAASTDLHESMESHGMMHMASLAAVPVAAGDSVVFAPMGKHVMLTGTTRGLAAGDTIALTLRFSSGRTLEVRAGVRQP
ncbi:MAG: copper chaperone PCu(A)C [Gemmatimonadaceae bacterium]|nr:copper chaperone PCu(A)C [Gemmatimonadaceae bacterium]